MQIILAVYTYVHIICVQTGNYNDYVHAIYAIHYRYICNTWIIINAVTLIMIHHHLRINVN